MPLAIRDPKLRTVLCGGGLVGRPYTSCEPLA
jgi:hypothetical protein